MTNRTLFILLFPLLFNANILFSQDSVDLKKTVEHFQEAQSLSNNDNGNLWGIKLYGPMMFVDPETRFVIANEEDNENYLVKNGEIYTGRLPKEVNIANTAFDWKGKKWTMIILPLPSPTLERSSLMMHELFHRIQDKLEFQQYNSSCDHLNQKDGRILVRLEWMELLSALKTVKEEKLNHIKNAMTLNKYRKILYAGADSLESQMELNEGIAEYTGLKLSGEHLDTIIQYEAQKIDMAYKIPSFVRSFAYISGPLYCYLLDASGIEWRNKLTKTTKLTDLLTAAYSIKLNSDLAKEAQVLLAEENNAGIVKYENEREIKRQEQLALLKQKFLSKPIILIRLQNMSIQFDPRNLVPLENVGTVYPNLRITDNWGILTVTNEALLSADWQSVLISLPDNFTYQSGVEKIQSSDWTIELKKGWGLKPMQREGSYILSKIE